MPISLAAAFLSVIALFAVGWVVSLLFVATLDAASQAALRRMERRVERARALGARE
jgi:uncharacterized membrane protein YciS (DUF1049 family)